MNNKIAIICNYELLPERIGGMDYFFWQFDARCKENGIAVDWFFPNLASHGDYSKLTIYSSNHQNVENFFLDFYKANRTIYSHITTHFVELCTPFFYKISKLSKAKIIGVDHNPRPINGYPLKKKFEKRLKGILLSRYINQFIGVSNYTVHELFKDFGLQIKSKSATIYNGVIIDNIRIREYRNTTKPAFLVASHLRESKGIQDLISAVYLLNPEIKKEIKIDIYGDGPFKNYLIAKLKTLSLERNFRLLGNVSNLKELYADYDYMLQPTHMECFSLSILESLAANVPVISTNVGGNEEVITNGENGFIFKVKNTTEFSSILENLFSGNICINSNTRKLIESDFTLDKMVENHFNLIKLTE